MSDALVGRPDATSGAAVSTHHTHHDYFVTRDGATFAGAHLIADFWGASNLDDPATIEAALIRAAEAAGATVLTSSFHHFSPGGGVSGVVVLAESHISIHTWPERAFAAVDVFMCGDCRPMDAVAVLKNAFATHDVALQHLRRGLIATPR